MLVARHLYTGRLFEDQNATPWRLNLTAVSSQNSLVAVAIDRHVSIFDIGHYGRIPTFRQKLAYPDPIYDDKINAISLDVLGGRETVIAVYDSGRSIAWALEGEFSVVWDHHGQISTWGCSIHSATNTVATSSNAHVIDVYRLNVGGARGDMANDNSENHQLLAEGFQLEGHTKNVPHIAFSAGGKYIASASIDSTIRVWSLRSRQLAFAFRYSQWCWAVRFVYPFYFMPAALAGELHDSRSAESDKSDEFDESDEADEADEPDEPDESDESDESDEFEGRAGTNSTDEYVQSSGDTNGGLMLSINATALISELLVDHAGDIQNGHTGRTPSPSAECNTDSARDISFQPKEHMVPEGESPHMASPLLFCCTERDVLLIDPSAQAQEAVVARIKNALYRESWPPSGGAVVFDRISFLEWIPDMSIAVVGSFSGTVAIIGVQTLESADGQGARYRMDVLHHLPEELNNGQLYGLSVYRHPVGVGISGPMTLFATYLDGKILAYEILDANEAGYVL
ncbi:hypothetical protein GGF37_002558 [Kickxella alabastrina]|nr:hypothetical protein GGF37_002558 [Kickxella alabastrina]